MMKLENEQIKQNLHNRLGRIEGQVRGVQTMIDSNRDCHEIIQQLSSIKSAVHSTSLLLMREYASKCLIDSEDIQGSDKSALLDDLFSLIGKAP